MSDILAGYSGASRPLSEQEQIEWEALTEITKILSPDIVGKQLLDRYEYLSLLQGTDTGYFYCPYIPIIETKVGYDIS